MCLCGSRKLTSRVERKDKHNYLSLQPAHHELSPLRFLREPHDSFRMNDKVVCIILSYYRVIIKFTHASWRTGGAQRLFLILCVNLCSLW